MNIGEKIKKTRIQKKLTQSDLAGEKITRNMISSIENGKATPSIDTVKYIAEKLDIPLAFLFSDDEDTFFFKKRERISAIKNLLDEKNYTVCINLILGLDKLDDELAFILADCYFNLGISAVKNGALQTGLNYLKLCQQYTDKTIYDTRRFKAILPLYLCIAENINSPLLEFEEKRYYDYLKNNFDFEFYRYLILDTDYEYTNPQLKMHISAKKLIKARKYSDAVKILVEIEETKGEYEYNSYLLYGVYTDLDLCFRQLFDFESAYKYSSKRISLLEGFKF